MISAPSLGKCDGCGSLSSPDHIRRRIERLEFASRFRPIHIQVLLLHLAPPLRIEDFFYRPAKAPGERSPGGQTWVRSVLARAGIGEDASDDEQVALAEFQRRNYFLTPVLECPLEEGLGLAAGHPDGDLAAKITRVYGPILLRRLQFSLKPKRVDLIGGGTAELGQMLEEAGWGDRLVRD